MVPTTPAAAPTSSNRVLLTAALLVSVYMLFAGLGKPALFEPDEGRNAEVGREMKESGAWVIPTLDGLPYMDKPAFYFRTVALTFTALGESEATARLSSALFGLALLIMTWFFCRRAYHARTAALAMMITATAPLYFVFSRLVIMDMNLAVFVCGAIFAGYIAEEKEGRSRARWYMLGAASAGFATLVKGPVGFVLPTLVLCVFNWLDGRRGSLKRILAPLNLVIFFGLTLAWFLAACRQRPDFAYYGLVRETFLRFTTSEFKRTGAIYYFVPWAIAGFWAWSLLLPESIVSAWQNRQRLRRADKLFLVWCIVAFLFFSVSQSKRPGYILTVMVALGGLTARVFDAAFERVNGRAAKIALRGAVALGVVSLLLAACGVLAESAPQALPKPLALRIEQLHSYAPSLVPLIVALVVVTLLACAARWRRSPRIAFACFVGFPVLVMTACFGGIQQYSETRSARALARQIPPLPPSTELVYHGTLPPALPFYLKRTFTVVSEDGYELSSFYIAFFLERARPWPTNVVHPDQFEEWVRSRDHPVYVLASKRGRADLEAAADEANSQATNLARNCWSALILPGKN